MGKFNKPLLKKNQKRTNLSKVYKEGKKRFNIKTVNDTSELRNELKRIESVNTKNPGKYVKNKEKRREIVMKRNSLRKKLKAKIRRNNQKDTTYVNKTEVRTIDNQREKDHTYIDLDFEVEGAENNEEETVKEHIKEAENDEFSSYFNKEYEPQIMITTSIKYTSAIFKFIKDLKDCIPNLYFYYREKRNVTKLIEFATEKQFTDIIIVYERLRKPYRLAICHLPDGPTLEFKLSNVIYHKEIRDSATTSDHNPELIFKNFKTKLGFRVNRALHSLFPYEEDLNGRRLITFHNQRDYIFFRHHRYMFNEEFDEVYLQEIGPRFTMRLLYIQKGNLDKDYNDYEWCYKDSMGVRRRKFYL